MRDDHGLSEQQAEQPARAGRRRLRWVALVCALVVGLGVVGYINWPRHHEQFFCAGVGLSGAPVAPTADEAMAAYLAMEPGRPPIDDWKASTISSNEVSYQYTKAANGQDRAAPDEAHMFDSIQVMGGVDGWTVTGACV